MKTHLNSVLAVYQKGRRLKFGEAFLLTVGAFLLTVELLCLQLELSCLQLSFFACSPLRPLLDALSHCKKKSSNCK